MSVYIGKEFDVATNKEYKKQDAAEAAAKKNNFAVFSENGEVLKDYRPVEEKPENEPDTKPQDYAEDTESTEEQDTETDVFFGVPAKRCAGEIKRIFPGSIRVRNRPAWDNDAVRGATTFTTKKVTHILEVDGKTMYRTADGYFITGAPELVEFTKM